MTEFIEACTGSTLNLVASVMLGVTMVYWIIVVVGAVGIDSLDFDFDVDTDISFDLDPGVDGIGEIGDVGDLGGGASGGSSGMLHAGIGIGILRFFHVGTVPILVLWSVFILLFWMIGVLAYPILGSWGGLLQLVLLIPTAFAALILTKIVTLPLKVLFEKMKEQEETEQKVNLIGKRCIVVSLTADARHGQVEVATDGAPLRLNVVTSDASCVLNKGDEAVLIAKEATKNAYIIRGF